MTTRGFVLGKFMPPHRGHLYLCETAMGMVDQLTILVCSTDAEPMPGRLRFQWMQDAAPGASVVHLHRNLPQEPVDHPDFWAIWRDVITEMHALPIDRVFGSETYVFRLAQELGAGPVLIDPNREVFPVSGSAIRENPAAHWDDITPPARGFFQKRLCLLGPESTGKSQIAAGLAARFKTRAMPEYGRTYDVYYKQKDQLQGAGWTGRDLLYLAQTHIAMREALAPHAGPLLVEDSDIIQTAVWAEHLLGAPLVALEEIAEIGPHADHYFLLSPEVRWIDDGVRYAGAEKTRQWFFDAAKQRLDRLDLNYDVIAGSDWDQRWRQATRLADRLFADQRPSPE